MTWTLRKNCCDPPCPSDVQPCDECGDAPPCELPYWFYGINSIYRYFESSGEYEVGWRQSDYEHGYMAGENDWFGYPVPDPDDVADSIANWSWMDRLWLAKIGCLGPFELPAYDFWGTPLNSVDKHYYSKYTYLNHHDLGSGNLVGALNWSQSACAYESVELNSSDPAGVYILKGEDSVNGKMFKPEGPDGKYVLVNEPTAPTLTLPDGTMRYTLWETTLNAWDEDVYSPRYVGGDRVFIDIDDTTLESTGYVPFTWESPNTVGNPLAAPSWLDENFTANTISVLPCYSTASDDYHQWSNNLEWASTGFTCAINNEYNV